MAETAELLPLKQSDSALQLSSTGTSSDEVRRQELFAACKSGDAGALKASLEIFSAEQIDAMLDDEGWGPLHYVAMKGHMELAKLLLDHGCNPNAPDKWNNIALYRATGFGHEDMVYYLVERGADPLHLNAYKNNMIHNSAWAAHVSITKFFLEKGVNPLDRDASNHIALWDMVNTIPEVTEEYFDTKIKKLTSHLLISNIEYNFDGLDDQDPNDHETTPLEIIVNKNIKNLISHRLVKKFLEWKWKVFARSYFYQQMFIYVFALVLFSFVSILPIEFEDIFCVYNETRDYVRGAFEILIVFFAFYELGVAVYEFPHFGYEIVHTPHNIIIRFLMLSIFKRTVDPAREKAIAVSVPRYLFSSANWFKIATYITILIEMGVRIANITWFVHHKRLLVSNYVEANLLATISVMFYMRFLSLAALIPFLGPLLVAVFRMIRDMIQFIVLYLVFFFGFSIAFYLLLGKSAIDYQNYGIALMTTFRALTGDFDWTIEFYSYDGLSYFILVIYLLIANIVLLTLLVAMMSNSFDLVKYDASKEFLLVRARYILYVQKYFGKIKINQLLAEDLKSRMEKSHAKLVGHNNTPDAEFIKTNQYSEWEDMYSKEEESEVNLQVLRGELLDKMKENQNKMEELFITMAARLDQIDGRLSGRPSQTQSRDQIRQSLRRSVAGREREETATT